MAGKMKANTAATEMPSIGLEQPEDVVHWRIQ